MSCILQTLLLFCSENYTLELKKHQFSVYLCKICYEDSISWISRTCQETEAEI